MRSNTARKDVEPKLKKAALVLGDQLTLDNQALLALDKKSDVVVMIEAHAEAASVWSHKARIALFFSAMRHFAQALRANGFSVHYVEANALQSAALADQLVNFLRDQQIVHALCAEPGDYRLKEQLQLACKSAGISLQLPEEHHFLCSHDDFNQWARPLKSLRMEFFYRNMRRKYKVLLDKAGEPEGGQWNFDAENRKGFPKSGPGPITAPAEFAPDHITQEVIGYVSKHFADHPGQLASFNWAVSRDQALQALEHFITFRLAQFGDYQDAMWVDMPFGWHSLIATSLNLKLLNPLEVIERVERAWRESLSTAKPLPLAAVEGFIRQVLGWREFIRGAYWLDMPALKTDNHYSHERELPSWYWTGKTRMRCVQQSVGQTLEHGYAHHIQRLMVTGNFALLAELKPQQVADWYLAIYVDAVEWVELPNVAGMALYANGGRITSKPYVASGAYINRMSNYCKSCPYKPEVRYGEQACPFTTLYWNFLDKYEPEFARNPRTILMAKSVQRLAGDERAAIKAHAQVLLNDLDVI